jgi:PAS fold
MKSSGRHTPLATAIPIHDPTGADAIVFALTSTDQTGLYTEVHESDLQSRLRNPEASFALTSWLMACRKGAVPDETTWLRPHLGWLWQDAMLLRPTIDNDFVYEHYGSRIVSHAGFDMTGKHVSAFKGSMGDFYLGIYRQIMLAPRAVATVHRLGNFLERPMWERVILPLSRSGTISALYVINRIRQLDHDFNMIAARAKGSGIIALQFTRDAAGEIEDAIVVGANKAARDMTNRRLDELLNRPMRDCFPGIAAAGLWDNYLEVSRTRQEIHRTVTYDQDGMSGTFAVTLAPFRDGVTIDFQIV